MRVKRFAQLVPRRDGLWGNKDYVQFWAAQSVSAAGSQITLLALPLLAAITLKASSVQIGLLVASGSVPIWIFGLFAGVWIDRLPRRPILIVADLGRAALLLLIPLASALNHLSMELLYAVAFLAGTLTVFFDIGRQSYLPVLVRRDQLVEANQQVVVSNSAAEVAGPGIAGGLIKILGAPVAIVFDAISFVASGLLLMRIHAHEQQIPRHEQQRAMLMEIREGVRWVFQDPVLRALALATGISNFFENGRFAVQILYLNRSLHLGPAAIGIVVMLGSVGYFIGAFLPRITSQTFGLGRAIMLAMGVIWIAELLFALAAGPNSVAVPLVIVALFLEGLGSPSYDVNQVSLRQAITPDYIRGRVNASLRVLIRGTVPLGAIAGGLVAASFGLRAAMVFGAFGPPIAILLIWFSPIRGMRVPPPPVDEQTPVATPALTHP
ncbi:MAG: MFS transporter [Thermomicrobiales bacterium]